MAGEKRLQQFIANTCKVYDTLCYKFESPGRAGVPDLICIPPHGRPVYFVEVKNPNGKGRVSLLQAKCHQRIQQQGTAVYVIDSQADAEKIIRERSHA
jgi:hypothetical protein